MAEHPDPATPEHAAEEAAPVGVGTSTAADPASDLGTVTVSGTDTDDAARRSAPKGPRKVRSVRPKVKRECEDLAGARFGDYSLIEHLGSGGMGSVYVARAVGEGAGVPVGARVAIKVLHSDLHASDDYRERFLREALLGGKIVHESVVSALDMGTQKHNGRQLTYLVLELVEGTTLKEMLVRLTRLPEALAREVAIQVAEGLAAIHAANVVHRDIKPSNVLITHGQRVRIMDLGIARLAGDDEEITRIGQFTGSVAYAAPERFGGGSTGPSCDLYSLGISMYQLVTGRLPFRGADLAAVVRAHLAERPRRADAICDDVSPFLAEVIENLMSKDPAERFPSAEVLAQVLREGEDSEWWAERESSVRSAGRFAQRIPIRRDAELCGRDEELDRLRDLWQHAAKGRGRVLSLTGEPGVGKTRLVDALALSVEEPNAQVLYGSYPPGTPRDALIDALIAHLGIADIETRVAELIESKTLAPTLAEYLRRGHAEGGGYAENGGVLHGLLVELMRGLAADGPLLWIVDDLHFASADAHAQLLALARAAADSHVLLVLSSRAGKTETLDQKLRVLSHVEQMDLSRLSPRAVVELVRDALGNHVMADRIGAEIAFKSDGVPFFVVEMIRSLEEDEHVSRLPDGTYEETTRVESIGVPTAVRSIIETRLRDLDPEDRNLLDLASVHGYEFDADALARSFDVPRIHVLQRLAGISRRTNVVQASGRKFRFDHHQVHEVVYADLPASLREEYHGLAAEHICHANGVSVADGEEIPHDVALALVRHAIRGPDPSSMAVLAPLVAKRLEDASRFADSYELCTRAVECGAYEEGRSQVDLIRRRGVLLRHLGRLDDGRKLLEDATSRAALLDDRELEVRCLCELASLHLTSGALEDAHKVGSYAVERLTDDMTVGLRAFAHQLCGDTQLYLGNTKKALSHHERGARMTIDANDRAAIPDSLLALGRVHLRMGQPKKTIVLARQAIGIAKEQGLALKISDCIGLIAVGILELGRPLDAIPHLRKQIDVLQRVGARDRLCIATSNLAAAFCESGQFAKSLTYFERQLQLARELGDRARELTAYVNLALVHASMGRVTEALDFGDRASELCVTLGMPPRVAITRQLRSSLFRLLGRLDDAERESDEAYRIGRDIGDAWITGLTALESARVCFEMADMEGARDLLTPTAEAAAKSKNLAFEAQARVLLARIALALADHPRARRELLRAAKLGEASKHPETIATTAALMVRTGDLRADEAQARFLEVADLLSVPARIEIHDLFFNMCGDVAHVHAAYALLKKLVDSTPPEFREKMLTENATHAAILHEHHRLSE